MQCVCAGGSVGAEQGEFSSVACVLVRNLDFGFFLCALVKCSNLAKTPKL